jgi:phage-related protein
MQNIDYTKKEEKYKLKRTYRGVYMGDSLVFTPLFLERFLIRISQKTMPCLISRKFFGGNN